MATLLGLPVELLAMIVEALEQDLLRQDRDSGSDDIYRPGVRLYKTVCLTCKPLNFIATPYLYQELELGLGQDHTPVRPLLRTLSAHPKLTKLVKILELAPNRHLQTAPPTPDELAAFTAALNPLKGEQIHDKIVGALRLGCHNAELLVVLCMTTEIHRLDFAMERRDGGIEAHEEDCSGCPHFLDSVQNILSHRSAVYKRLEDVAVQGKSDADFGSATRIALRDAILKLPSVSYLHFSGLPRLEAAPLLRFPDPSSTIREISVCGGFVGTRALNNIINSCKALEKLDIRYSTLYAEPEDEGGSSFDLDAQAASIFAALLQHRDTLRTLEFTNLNYEGLDLYQISTLATLSTFSVLNRIEVEESRAAAESDSLGDFGHLTGFFPAALQDLTIHTHRPIEDLHVLLTTIFVCKLEHLEELEIIFRVGQGRNEGHATAWRKLPGGLLQKNSAGSLGWRDVDSSGTLVFHCKWRLLMPKLVSVGTQVKELAVHQILELYEACRWLGPPQGFRRDGSANSQAIGS